MIPSSFAQVYEGEGKSIDLTVEHNNPDNIRNWAILSGVMGAEGPTIVSIQYFQPGTFSIEAYAAPNTLTLNGSILLPGWRKNKLCFRTLLSEGSSEFRTKYVAQINTVRQLNFAVHGGYSKFQKYYRKWSSSSYYAGISLYNTYSIKGHTKGGYSKIGEDMILRFAFEIVRYSSVQAFDNTEGWYDVPSDQSRDMGMRLFLETRGTTWGDGGLSVHFLLGVGQGIRADRILYPLLGMGIGYAWHQK